MKIIYHACHIHDEWCELSDEEYAECFERGAEIYYSSQERNLKDNRNFTRNGVTGLRAQQLGEVSARAIAKALGLPWTNSMDTFKGADLPCKIECRLIGRDRYGLRVYETDKDWKRVVGCIIEPGREREPYRLPGWINAKHGKKTEWLDDPLNRGRPAFFVPQDKLHGLDVLRALIK